MFKNDIKINDGLYELYFLCDTHFPRGKYNLFTRVIEEIAEKPYRKLIGLGDWVEGIIPGDKRYNPEEISFFIKKYGDDINMLDVQYEYVEEAFEPLVRHHQIIGLHNGNHELPIMKHDSMNLLRGMCKRLRTECYGSGAAITSLRNHKGVINILSHHGVGGGVTPGYAYNQLDKHSNIFDDIDVIAEGHTHKLGINISEDRLKHNGKGLHHTPQYHLACGSFLGNYDFGYSSYAELRMYKPLPLGYVKMTIDGCKIREVATVVL